MNGHRSEASTIDQARWPDFSVCTIVTRASEYREMKSSFVGAGFSAETSEYLVHDNSETNTADAYQAINTFLLVARAETLIVCHQDIRLMSDGVERLQEIISYVSHFHPNWAVLGNAGADASGRLIARISDPYGDDQSIGGPFPRRVVSLDENFLVIRRAANLALSRDVGGFHFYGADLCIIADVLGWEAFVVDFHLRHKSAGTADAVFQQARMRIQTKYARAFRERWVHGTTAFPFFLASSERSQSISFFARRLSKALGIVPRANRRPPEAGSSEADR